MTTDDEQPCCVCDAILAACRDEPIAFLFVDGFVEGRAKLRARLCDEHLAIIDAEITARSIAFRAPKDGEDEEALARARAAYQAKIGGFHKERREAESVERALNQEIQRAAVLAAGRGRAAIADDTIPAPAQPETEAERKKRTNAVQQHFGKLHTGVEQIVTEAATKLRSDLQAAADARADADADEEPTS